MHSQVSCEKIPIGITWTRRSGNVLLTHIGMSGHPGGDSTDGGARERPVFPARSADVWRGRAMPSGQGASRWLLPGGQRGLSAAVLAPGGGGRMKIAWRRARGLGRLRRR